MIETRDFRDDLYIEDLESLDKDMLEDAVKNAKEYNFRGLNRISVESEAIKCFLEAVVLGLRHVGVNLDPPIFHAALQQYQTKHGDVEIENRIKYRGENRGRNGCYIFKKGELVHFVGAPVEQRQSRITINPRPHFVVKTNVRTS